MSDATKKHHHLVCGTILFQDKESEQVSSLMLNCTIVTDEREVPSKEIGRAQQTLQMLLFRKLEDPTIVIMDVVIISISHLGLMTSEEFLAPPEGTERQQVDVLGGKLN